MKAALDFISKDVQQNVEQNNLEYTDFEAAALIYNSGLSVLEIHKRLEELTAATEDDDDFKLLMATSDLLRGRGGLDWFVDCYDAYKEKCQIKKENEN